jgi:hypothetical protein
MSSRIQFRYPVVHFFLRTQFHWLVPSHGPSPTESSLPTDPLHRLVSCHGPSSLACLLTEPVPLTRLFPRTKFHWQVSSHGRNSTDSSVLTDPIPQTRPFSRTQFHRLVRSHGPNSTDSSVLTDPILQTRLFSRTQFHWQVSSHGPSSTDSLVRTGPVPLTCHFQRTQFHVLSSRTHFVAIFLLTGPVPLPIVFWRTQFRYRNLMSRTHFRYLVSSDIPSSADRLFLSLPSQHRCYTTCVPISQCRTNMWWMLPSRRGFILFAKTY